MSAVPAPLDDRIAARFALLKKKNRPGREARERSEGRLIGIPMPTGRVRSLNLATAVGIVLYEALRQVHGW